VHAQTDRVSEFYDDNTGLFLSLGQGTEGTIHRAVWGPGVENRAAAMAYVDGLILRRLERLAASVAERAPRVADLGCGVGASLCRIAKQRSIEGVGVTISAAQAKLARRRIEDAGLAASVQCVEADFCALPAGLASVELAFSIEAFVHAPSAADYFSECARLVAPG